MSYPDAQLGEFGEQEVRSRLERALVGTGMQISGFADKGIDLILQFSSPSPTNQPLHFGVQVKTGNSFAVEVNNRWLIKNLDETRFQQWKHSKLPVLLIWVRPTNPAECYWRIIRPSTDRKHLEISKRSIISPSIRYDCSIDYFYPLMEEQKHEIKLLRPPLAQGMRPFAKDYYRELIGNSFNHPFLGKINFTWKGWKHITAKKRPLPYIYQSMQLLSAIPWVVQNPSEFIGMRRLGKISRGSWTTEVRLLIFKTNDVRIVSRTNADIIMAFRERIRYPSNWQSNVNLHREVEREIAFESIYEKMKKK